MSGARAGRGESADDPERRSPGGTGRGPTSGGATATTSRTPGPARRTGAGAGSGATPEAGTGTALQRCVRDELQRYFALLDGEPPSGLYRLVMHQVEASLIDSVLRECGGNRTRAADWLGISRGTLRGKLADHDSD